MSPDSWKDIAAEYVRILSLDETEQGIPLLCLSERAQRLKNTTNRDVYEVMSEALEELGSDPVLLALVPSAAFCFVPIVVSTQHAVGHGGFHTGTLGSRRPLVRWIYDCGSWRRLGKRSLSQAIDSFAGQLGDARRAEFDDRPVVDLLFVSHFDADHVSGLESLLGRIRVASVVIPYMERQSQFANVAEALARHEDAAGVADVVLDPATWFSERGVARIVRVRAGANPTAGLLRELPPIVPEGWRRSGAKLMSSGLMPLADLSALADVTVEELEVEPGISVLMNVSATDWTDWALVPHVHPISDDARRRVEIAIKRILGVDVESPEFSDRLRQILTSQSDRRALRNAYWREGLGDANAVSMSVYSGPVPDADITKRTRARVWYCREERIQHGWLLTGDAELGLAGRRREWLNAFAPFKRWIGRMMIPHHGAAANWHVGILDAVKPGSELFVTANDGDKLRPHERVTAEVDGCALRIVSELPSSSIREITGPTCIGRLSDAMTEYFEDW